MPVYVVSVNDAFVMKAWAKSLDPEAASGIRFLADPHGEFTRAMEMLWDGRAIFGNERSKRYAIKVEDGRVGEVFVEPDNTGVDGESRCLELQNIGAVLTLGNSELSSERPW